MQAVLPSRARRMLIRQHSCAREVLGMLGMADKPDKLVENLVISLD